MNKEYIEKLIKLADEIEGISLKGYPNLFELRGKIVYLQGYVHALKIKE